MRSNTERRPPENSTVTFEQTQKPETSVSEVIHGLNAV